MTTRAQRTSCLQLQIDLDSGKVEEDGGPYASFWGYARLTTPPPLPPGPGNEARGEAGEGREGVGVGGRLPQEEKPVSYEEEAKTMLRAGTSTINSPERTK